MLTLYHRGLLSYPNASASGRGTNKAKKDQGRVRQTNASSQQRVATGRGDWLYGLKLDGYRALAIKTDAANQLRSRNNNDFTLKYPLLPKALAAMPDGTVLDGEVVALDASGRPSFNTLQNYSSPAAPIYYYVLDVLVLKGRTVVNETLDVRRELLRSEVLPKLREPIRFAEGLHASVPHLLKAVRTYGLKA